MKKLLILIFTLIMSTNVYAAELDIVSRAAVLMDCKTGRVLWQKNMNEEMAMASTTKIMTAIIALESGMLEDTVAASKNAASAPKVKMGLQTGEKHRLYDLLYPLMLESSNDAAVAIAEHIGGSIEGFAEMMNSKAKEIGAENTEFVTPNGLDKDNHHSTAYDMALIAGYALENDEFMKIINTKSITIPLKNMEEKQYSFYNKNRLLSEFDGAIGVKTGYTNKAGNCFVGAAERNGEKYVSVVLASGWGTRGKEQKWTDTKALLNYGFENYDYYEVIDENFETKDVIVSYSREGVVETEAAEMGTACLREDEAKNLKIKVNMITEKEAPVSKGEKLGTLKAVLETGEVVFETDIVATDDIKRHDFKTCVEKVMELWFNINGEMLSFTDR